MTLKGIFAIILEVCLIVMALGTDIKDFLIVAVCIGGLLLCSLFSVLWAAFTLRYRVSAEQTVTSRQDVISFNLDVKGICFIPVICKITISPPFYNENITLTPLSHSFIIGFSSIKRRHIFSLECMNTGHWNLGIKHIRVRDIFGFFSYPFPLTKKYRSVDITVLPKLHPVPQISDTVSSENEYLGASLQNSELGEVLSDNREYTVGDPLRRINWKQSAKTGKLFTRMFEKAEEPMLIIAIDPATQDRTGNTQDICREAALFLSEYYISIGFSVKILTVRDGSVLPMSFRKMKEIDTLRMCLTDITFKSESSPLLPTHINSNDYFDADKIFIISAYPDAPLLDDSFTVKNGVETKLIIAGNDVPHIKSEESQGRENLHFNHISLPDDIPVKVGELL